MSPGTCAPQGARRAGAGPGGAVADLAPSLAWQQPASLCPVSRPAGLCRGLAGAVWRRYAYVFRGTGCTGEPLSGRMCNLQKRPLDSQREQTLGPQKQTGHRAAVAQTTGEVTRHRDAGSLLQQIPSAGASVHFTPVIRLP